MVGPSLAGSKTISRPVLRKAQLVLLLIRGQQAPGNPSISRVAARRVLGRRPGRLPRVLLGVWSVINGEDLPNIDQAPSPGFSAWLGVFGFRENCREGAVKSP